MFGLHYVVKLDEISLDWGPRDHTYAILLIDQLVSLTMQAIHWDQSKVHHQGSKEQPMTHLEGQMERIFFHL